MDIAKDEEIIEIPAEAFELDEEIEVESPPPPPPRPEEEQIFKVVEEMPRFPGCEQKAIGRRELKKCSQEEMLRFMAENIKYPKIAKENGVEGTAVIQFVVGKSGKIKKAKVLRDPGAGCGNEALRVVNTMPLWIAGKQRGRPVDVQYTLPVAFKLPKEEPILYAPQDIEEPEEERIFKVVEEMPRFPGCENQGLNKSEKKICSDEKMLDFIYKNIVYPEVAKTNGIEGRVILKFMVGEDGSISKVKVLRDPGGGCGKEAERVVNMMPNFIPGKQRGKTVKIWYTMPVSFMLPKEKTKSKN
jgi:TonB family protein